MLTASLRIAIFISIASCVPTFVSSHQLGYCTIVPNKHYCRDPELKIPHNCTVIALGLSLTSNKNVTVDRPICPPSCVTPASLIPSCFKQKDGCIIHGVGHCKEICGDDRHCSKEFCVGISGQGCSPPHEDHVRSVLIWDGQMPTQPPQPTTPRPSQPPPTSSSSPEPEPTQPPPSKSGNSLWPYLAISAGSVAMLAILLMVCYVWIKKQTPQKIYSRSKLSSEITGTSAETTVRSDIPSTAITYPTVKLPNRSPTRRRSRTNSR